jgi:hypothetical protein
MSAAEARYCAMGERCTQARRLEGKPAKLRRTSKGDLCEQCIQEGYTLGDASAFHSDPASERQAADQRPECARCGKPAVAGYGDTYFCGEHWEQLHAREYIAGFSPADEPSQPPEEMFNELFRAARVLFAANVA